MLERLRIKNLAIIDELELEFKKHFTAISGVTGSGKSLIISSIGFLFGNKMDTDLIKIGAEKILIEAEFTVIDSLKPKLSELGIDDDFLVIRREFDLNKKSVFRINSTRVSLKEVVGLGNNLINIFNQGFSFTTLTSDYFLSFFISDEINALLSTYIAIYKEYKSVLKKISPLKERYNDFNQNRDYYQFCLQEFIKINLKENEENTLKEKIIFFSKNEKIKSALNKTKFYLQESALSALKSACSELKSFSGVEKISALNDRLANVVIELQDIAYDKALNLDFEEENLDSLNERLSNINQFKRKYNLDSFLDYEKKCEELKKMVLEEDKFILEYNALEKEYNVILNKIKEASRLLTDARIKYKKVLQNEIETSLKELDILNPKIDFLFSKGDFKQNGVDVVSVYVSFNKNEPLKPIELVASGGEMSRFLLSLETTNKTTTLEKITVFDEVDTGLSGEASFHLGLKLSSLGKASQTIVVSHSPQVLSRADNHLFVKKIEEKNNTRVAVKELSFKERVNELARIISNDKITEASIKNAEELLK